MNLNSYHAEAFAKVNPCLEILGRREDGYHELDGLIATISLAESVRLTVRKDAAVHVETRARGVDASELASVPFAKQIAVKAYRAFWAQLPEDAARIGCDMQFTKRVPIGAGMAGGSADGVAALRALNAASPHKLTEAQILAAAAAVGSDLPALWLGGGVRMRGRGERVDRVAPPRGGRGYTLVMAFGGTHVPTKDVYAACDAPGAPATHREGATDACLEAWKSGDPRAFAASLYNGLQPIVDELFPATRELRERMIAAGALNALLSGSGGAVFGVAEDPSHAQRIVAHLPSNLWTRVVQC